MRIGILTLPLHTNFGGILQAYALQTVLNRMGHDSYVIAIKQQRFSFPFWKRPLVYSYRFLQCLKGKRHEIFLDKKINRDFSIIEKNTKIFINQYIRSWPIARLSDITPNDFDAIIVGSDQVWRKFYFESTYYTEYEDAFLRFAKDWNIKKIAYACSFGFDKWPYDNDIAKSVEVLLSSFDAVSVREDSAITVCKESLNTIAVQVLDPTLLLNREDYEILISSDDFQRIGNSKMMVYILDDSDEKKEVVSKIAIEKNLKPFFFDAKIDQADAPTDERIQFPLTEWLAGFNKAELIVTDSFHACVFSIIFNKPFIVLKNNDRGNTRLDSLFRLLSIKNPTSLLSESEYVLINKRICELKEKSFANLRNSIHL